MFGYVIAMVIGATLGVLTMGILAGARRGEDLSRIHRLEAIAARLWFSYANKNKDDPCDFELKAINKVVNYFNPENHDVDIAWERAMSLIGGGGKNNVQS